ncbi:MAG: FAD-dependent oxidoreductase [Candidatus Brevundimonas phytovorans]|nr:FAD-dependent oxidoreductase [Brevundimonas sp.]WEK56736.1 MAG: FAD-dependent oxidoreductase [Brevundimonas sp.]
MHTATKGLETQVLVVGSGAAGLVAALRAAETGASVLIIEKSDEIGGTSATSGGGIWIPCSRMASAIENHTDDEDQAFGYMRALAADWSPNANIRSFLRHAPRMLDWLSERTALRYAPLPYPDYHPELEGGKTGWRTHLPEPIDARALKKDMRRLRRASPAASLGGVINWTFAETYALLYRPKGWMRTLAGMASRYALDLPYRLTTSRDRYLTLGNALTGGLLMATEAAGVRIQSGTALSSLIVEDGQVTGARVRRDGKIVTIATSRVILAAGGYERNADLRARHLPTIPDPTHSGSQINNTGDAILAAEAVGAALTGLGAAWWAPVFRVPGESRARLCTIERALPGCIMVDQSGRRFMNEAMSYHLAGQAMATHMEKTGASSFWMIFDSRYRRLYPMGPLLPLIPDSLHRPSVRKMIRKADDAEGLARKIGADPHVLKATLERFNPRARDGQDPDFARGESAYDRMYGDQRISPNPTLAAIDRPPYYAIPIYPGDIGTCGGVSTDGLGRALTPEGQVIEGLYAVGNCAASVMGGAYPGAGSTLGPALTFAYTAASHATGRSPD